jgi:hypothetical protein
MCKLKQVEQDKITYYECDSCGFPFKHEEVVIEAQTVSTDNGSDCINWVSCPFCEEMLVYEPYCYIAREVQDTRENFVGLRNTFEELENKLGGLK